MSKSYEKDPMGKRLKGYEEKFCNQVVYADEFVVIRLDGSNFSKFTKLFKKPFDNDLYTTMRLVSQDMLKYTNADFVYTQSDEISLFFKPKQKENSEFNYGGKIFKLNSLYAAKCSLLFNKIIKKGPNVYDNQVLINHIKNADPIFDCRTFTVKDIYEFSNSLLWRMRDSSRNAVSTVGQSVFSAKELHKKTSNDIIFMLNERGININNYDKYRYGSLFHKVNKDTLDIPNDVSIPEYIKAYNGEFDSKIFLESDTDERISLINDW